MNNNLLRLHNYICRKISSFSSCCFSFMCFGSPRYIKVGRNILIYGYKTIKIGKGCSIRDNSTIRGSVEIADNVFIHENVLIRADKYHISIGKNTTINRNTNILSQCKIGESVSIAPNVVIVGSNHVFTERDKDIKSQGTISKGIIIEDDVWIATNATILDGVTIGRGSIVAAGAVVNKDIDPYSIVGGVPAKLLKYR